MNVRRKQKVTRKSGCDKGRAGRQLLGLETVGKRTCCLCHRAGVPFLASVWKPVTVITVCASSSWGLMPSSGFHGHCIYMPETTHTHKIKIKFQKKNRIFSMLVKRKHDFLKYFHGKQSIMAHPCKLNN